MSNMTKLMGEVTQPGILDTSNNLRVMCAEPGICNHNGSPKPVVTLTPNGFWAYCRWSKAMEFVSWEQCDAFRQSCAGDEG